MIAGGAIAVALALTAQSAAPAPAVGADVTVTGRRLPTKPIRDAIGYFERHCFDASRLTGAPSTPRHDPAWRPLTVAERRVLGGAAGDGPAHGMRTESGQVLALTTSMATPHAGLVEHRCTLIVAGGDQARFEDRIGAMFGAAGTRRHLGEIEGSPVKPGWRQLLWTAMPSRGAGRWQAFQSHSGESAWLKILEWDFYDEYEYVVADFRARTEGAPLTVVTLIHTRRLRTGR